MERNVSESEQLYKEHVLIPIANFTLQLLVANVDTRSTFVQAICITTKIFC